MDPTPLASLEILPGHWRCQVLGQGGGGEGVGAGPAEMDTDAPPCLPPGTPVLVTPETRQGRCGWVSASPPGGALHGGPAHPPARSPTRGSAASTPPTARLSQLQDVGRALPLHLVLAPARLAGSLEARPEHLLPARGRARSSPGDRGRVFPTSLWRGQCPQCGPPGNGAMAGRC